MSARQLEPADLHRAAVKDVADLTHMSGRSLNQSVTVLHDGVFRVRCSQKQIEQMDLSRLMSTSQSGQRRALGRYASSMSAGYATDPSALRVRSDGQTKLDLIMRNGRRFEDTRDDELSQQVITTRYQELLVREDVRQTKNSIKR